MNGGAWLTITVLAAIWPFGRVEDESETSGTIRDLDPIIIDVQPGAPIESSDAKAMESYRLFLDLASNDAVLQAEAMRRLADLQLETEEGSETAQNVEALGDALGGTIDLYEQLLESYPDYEKNDLVLYQLSRAYEAGGDTQLQQRPQSGAPAALWIGLRRHRESYLLRELTTAGFLPSYGFPLYVVPFVDTTKDKLEWRHAQRVAGNAPDDDRPG